MLYFSERRLEGYSWATGQVAKEAVEGYEEEGAVSNGNGPLLQGWWLPRPWGTEGRKAASGRVAARLPPCMQGSATSLISRYCHGVLCTLQWQAL